MSDLLPPEIDLGILTELKSILRNPKGDELSAINNAKKSVTWKNERSVEIRFFFPAEKASVRFFGDSIFSDEIDRDSEKSEDMKKKRGGNGERRTKKKSNGRPQTEEEVMADIGRKIENAGEKATRMKQLKIKEAEIRNKKKEDEKKKKDEKKRKKKEEMELENQRKEEDERNEMECKPKSRAEAARRTKALLAKGNEEEGRTSSDEEEDDEPKTKKRKYKKRTKSVPFTRRVKEVNEEESLVVCGKYVDNPNDVIVRTVCEEKSMEEDESEGMVDEILSVPFASMNCEKEKESTEQIQSNTHTHGHMERHVNEVKELFDEVTHEYREMMQRLDGMKLNLFADTTLRKFDTRVIRNMDFLSATGMWPDELLPIPNRFIPKWQYLMWNTPFKSFIRIVPSHKKKDKLTSREIDLMSGGGADRVTKRDITKNLNDLIMSKLTKTSWTPLPNARNPFDVPEISTRIKAKSVKEYQYASRSHNMGYMNMPCEYMNKKRKKTRKEALVDLANRRTVEENESIYKEDTRGEEREEDGYQYEWDEMGEIMDNPMRDVRLLEDVLGHPFHGQSGVDVDGDAVMEVNTHNDDEETGLGEAFSFMAAHMQA